MLQEGNIVLRPLHDSDAPVLAQLANNKKVWDNLRDDIPFPYSLSDAKAFIALTQQQSPQTSFAIECHKQLCGVIGLVAQTDVYKKTAEIGYWLGEPYWNRGITTVAVKLVTDYGFNQLHFIRIHTGVFEYNTGSMKVLIKNGYAKDGVFTKAVYKNGNMYDEHRFSKTI